MQRSDNSRKWSPIPSIPPGIQLGDLKPNGKLLTEEEIKSLAADVSNQIHPGVDYSIIQIEGKQYICTKKMLGEGGFGKVFVGQELESGKFKALKFQSEFSALKSEVAAECQTLNKVGQVASLQDGIMMANDQHYCLVMDLIPGIELFYLRSKPMSTIRRLQLALGAMNAILALHALNLIHRDIKPDNLMAQLISGMVTPVDFGQAIDLENRTSVQDKICGTMGYMAPEVLLSGHHSRASDVYSLGMTIATLCDLIFVKNQCCAGVATVGSKEFLDNKKIPDIKVRTALLGLLQQMTDGDRTCRITLPKAKEALQEIIDSHLSLLNKINNIGLINIKELVDEKDPGKYQAMLAGLRQFDEVWFVNPPDSNISTLKLVEIKQYFEKEGISVGERKFDYNDYGAVRGVFNYEQENCPSSINLYFFVTADPAKAQRMPTKGRICPFLVSPEKKPEDYQAMIANHYNQIVDPAHINLVIIEIKKNMGYLEHKYLNRNRRNAKLRCEHMETYLYSLNAAKVRITYAELVRSLEVLQRQMITETWTFTRMFGFFGAKTTAACHIRDARRKFIEATERSLPVRKPYDGLCRQ
jgi:serine/threonine protein kinase